MKKADHEQPYIMSSRGIFLLAALPFLLIFLFTKLQIADQELPVRALTEMSLFALLAAAVWWLYKGRMTPERALRLLLLAGIVVRLGYMLYTHCYVRQHDLGDVGQDGTGHFGYIVWQMLQGHLPPTNENQFYHPPLYHGLAAAAIKAGAFLCGTQDYVAMAKFAMSVSCTASCVTLVMAQRLMDSLSIDRKSQSIAVAVLGFFPNFILMGGRLNNDGLVTMFMVMAVYYAVKWYRTMEWRWIVALALSVGFGMMTKMSCGTVAVFIGPLMLYKLYEGCRKKAFRPVILQLAVFGLICFPLALWYPVRNWVEFGQSLGYVLDLGKDSVVYTGHVPFLQRFLCMPVGQIFDRIYMDPYEDSNIFMILTRTAVFGEFTYENVSRIVSTLLYFVNLLLIGLSLVAMAAVCREYWSKGAFYRFAGLFMAAVWAVSFVTYLVFNVQYPYGCSADMRYIPLAAVAGSIFMAMALPVYKEKKWKLGAVQSVAAAAFCVLAAIMYC